MKYLFALITFAFVAGLHAQTPIVAGTNSKLVWDAVTENTDGTPADDIAGYQVVIVKHGQALNDFNILAKAFTSDVEQPISFFIESAIEPGSYDFAVRAKDAAGNFGGWGRLDLVTFDTGIPKAPGRIQIINVTITTEIIN